MQPNPSYSDARLIALARTSAAVAAGFTTLLGALVLAGWAFNLSLLEAPVPGQASMKPITALGLLLAGAALWLLRQDGAAAWRGQSWQSRLGLIGAGLVAMVGGLILLEYLLGINLGIDQLLFRQAVLAENALPAGRAAPATALCLLLLGLALLSVDSRPAWLSPAATLLAVSVGALAVMGYTYEVTTLYQSGSYVPIAPHTAVAIVILGLGLLAARPRGPILGVLTTRLSGSVVGRRLLPVAIVVPFGLGLIRLYGQRLGLYDTGFGVALLVTSNVVVFATLIYASARLLNRSDAQRQAVHDALRLTEENLRLMLDSIKDHAIFMLDTEGRVATWNEGAQRIKGYTAEEVIGQPVSIFYLPEDAAADKPRRALQAAADRGAVEEEGWRLRKDGTRFWAIADTAALRDERGELRGYSKVTRDITERKRAEGALRQSEERFAKAFRASPAAITVTRVADGRFVDVNARFLELLGYQRDEVIGQTSAGLHMFPDPGDRIEPVRRLQAEGTVHNREMTLLTKTGQRRDVVFSMELIELEGEAHALATVIDNTERKQAEEALRQLNAELETRVEQRTAELAASEVKFRTMFDVLPVGVSVLDDKGQVVDSNPALARILQISSAGLTAGAYDRRNFSYADGTPVPAEDFPSARVVREQRPISHVEMSTRTAAGDTIWIDASGAPLPLAGLSAVIVTVDLTERKQIEFNLRQSDERFAQAFRFSPIALTITRSADGSFIDANEGFLSLFGYGREEVIGRRAAELNIVTDLAERAQMGRHFSQQGYIHNYETVRRTKSGELRHVLLSADALELNGEVHILSTMLDITARKLAEAAVFESEAKFRTLFEVLPVGVSILDDQRRVVDSNPALARIMKMSTAALATDPYGSRQFIHPDGTPMDPEEFPSRRVGRAQGPIQPVEMGIITEAGETIWVEGGGAPLPLAGLSAVLVTTDLSERKRTESALRESEEKFSKAFHAIGTGVLIAHTGDGRIIDVNDGFLHLSGYERADVIGRSVQELGVITPAVRDQIIARLRERGHVQELEIELVTRLGEIKTVLVSIESIMIGGVPCSLSINQDITERKRIESALRESQEKFSKSFHASGAGIIISRAADGKILEANDSYLRLVGYERDEIMGRTTLEIGAITPVVRQQLVGAIRQHGYVRDMEIGVVTKLGENRTVITSTENIVIGNEACLLSILYDITERKRIEQALASERDQLQALLDNVPDTIYFKDRASRFTRINLAQARMLGVASPELAIGKTDADFQDSPLAAEFFAEEQKLLDSGQPLLDRVEFNPTPAGEPRWLSATKVPLKDANGTVMGLVGISRDVTQRVMAETSLKRVNQQLADRVDELSLLNKYDEHLQACLTNEETYQLTAQIMGQLAPGQPGALYVIAPGHSQASTAAAWGAPALEPQLIAFEDCWALRRGQMHLVDGSHPGLACRHVLAPLPPAMLCMPLMVQGQTLGMLHLRAADEANSKPFDEAFLQLARVIADSLALTMANLTLRESLRQQAIRDPLTGLFNRRFMEESLGRELNRAARTRQSVGMIMLDVDRFKQVNDRFGHEAGDAVLRAIGHLLDESSRGSDIPCRYGGEEFLLILPDASLEITAERAEHIRQACGKMEFGFNGNQPGHVTVSLGVAAYPQHGEALEVVLRAADAALYRAKHEGRDRTVIAA